jgi:hypothetical protein
MIKPEIFYDFIRNFYVIEYYKRDPLVSIGEIKRDIFIRDVHETTATEARLLPITHNKNVNPLFFWTKFYQLTEVDIFHKEINVIPTTIVKMFTHTQSLDFYNYLIEYDEHVIIPLNMIKNEFPGLYGT